MNKNRREKGFTLAEALLTVAIVLILAAVVFVAVHTYLRSMTKLEYDAFAKEIFVAAQNHLSMAESQGYLGRTDFGIPEKDSENKNTGVYYFVKAGNNRASLETTVFDLMLPFAAVDEHIRASGCYIIRYHRDAATVLDVFYWEDSGRFRHNYADNYADFMTKTGEEHKSELRTYVGDSSVIGWYGGAEAAALTKGAELLAPKIVVTNADKLTVTVTDFNKGNPNAKLKLIITGVTSKNSREITLSLAGLSEYYSNSDVTENTDNVVYRDIVLDDITQSGKHFADLFCTGTDPLIPGEDITIQAVAYNNSELTNVAYSTKQTTNSLFAYNDSDKASAHVSYIRHLENLDRTVSSVNVTNSALKHVTSSEQVSALQTTDLTWNASVYPRIYGASGQLTDAKFKPVNTADYTMTYDGALCSITGIDADTSGSSQSAGLFGDLTGDTVRDLKLVDFTIAGGTSGAGALAGTALGSTVANVVAINSSSSAAATISGAGDVGGLIGRAQNSQITKSAAALVVSSSGIAADAGGLIGEARAATVSACYSGGHTQNGAYDPASFNVTAAGGSAGGLIGTSTGSTVYNSYSTCSAKGAAAGGLAAAIDGGLVSNCYATGLVNATASSGAFVAEVSGSAQLSNLNYYYEIVNELDAGADGKRYMDPGSADIDAFDETSAIYNAYLTGTRKSASAYDASLVQYYQGDYALLTVEQLGASVSSTDFVAKHFGDWPSPEVRIINIKN
ncbi:MAG: type II secretion system protein [Clostridia bacterium]|nr:type II secretion system protein [Clostridia bacterium]